MANANRKTCRRGFLSDGVRVAGAIALGGAAGFVAGRKGRGDENVWQIDPDQCMACGNCATYCVLDVSAVKAVQCYPMCAMCDLCTGYFDLEHVSRDTGAENQLCPTGAIDREMIPDASGAARFEYHIDEPECIGCGKCVEGCAMMNGSLYLQVRHDRCLNCNQCSIAVACPTQAFRRVPAGAPYLIKSKARQMIEGDRDNA
jgi:electron transport complex protein RnfB